eukprot:10260441-Alexandrium_andersonii.AAC.1
MGCRMRITSRLPSRLSSNGSTPTRQHLGVQGGQKQASSHSHTRCATIDCSSSSQQSRRL